MIIIAKPKNTDRPFYFDGKNYHQDLRKALKRANLEIKNKLLEIVKRKASGLPFKNNQVKLADGTVTSDAKRKMALLESITHRHLGWQEGQLARKLYHVPLMWKVENTAFASEVSAMGEGNYKESHIGNYYEYGTGEKEDVGALKAVGVSMGDDNPFRVPKSGQPIVSRPSSTWRDMGGNLRKSYGKGGVGRENEQFSKYIGEDIEAYRWFKSAYEELRDSGFVKDTYLKHIRSVNISDYIHVKKKIILGGRKLR